MSGRQKQPHAANIRGACSTDAQPATVGHDSTRQGRQARFRTLVKVCMVVCESSGCTVCEHEFGTSFCSSFSGCARAHGSKNEPFIATVHLLLPRLRGDDDNALPRAGRGRRR